MAAVLTFANDGNMAASVDWSTYCGTCMVCVTDIVPCALSPGGAIASGGTISNGTTKGGYGDGGGVGGGGEGGDGGAGEGGGGEGGRGGWGEGGGEGGGGGGLGGSGGEGGGEGEQVGDMPATVAPLAKPLYDAKAHTPGEFPVRFRRDSDLMPGGQEEGRGPLRRLPAMSSVLRRDRELQEAGN